MTTRIINESTSAILIDGKSLQSAQQAIVYLSTTTIPGQIVSVVDATGFISSPQGILISTVGGATLLNAEYNPVSSVPITQQFGYITLHSDLEDPTAWSVVDTYAFPQPAASYGSKGLNTNTLFTGSASNAAEVSTSRAQARIITAGDMIADTRVHYSSLYVNDVLRHISAINTDPRLYINGSAHLEASTITNGRLFLRGQLSTGSNLEVFRNISSKSGGIGITGDIMTLSNIRNTRGFITSVSSLSTTDGALFVRDAVFYNQTNTAASLFTRSISTPRTRALNINATSSIQFGYPPSDRYWKYVSNMIDFQNLPVTTPSISTSALTTLNSVFTSDLQLTTFSTSETLSQIALGSTVITNASGSLSISSLTANKMITFTSIKSRKDTIGGTLVANNLLLSRTGAAATGEVITYPPNDPAPLGQSNISTNWKVSSPSGATGSLNAPYYALLSQFISASEIKTSSVRAISTSFTNMTATDITVSRALNLANASSFVVPAARIENRGGNWINTNLARATTLQASSMTVGEIIAPSSFTFSVPAVRMSTASISTIAANSATTSSILLTSAALGAPYEYSTILPYISWLQASTFQLDTPPFQTTTGRGTYFDRVFFTAAKDGIAYYSITDPRAQVDTTLSSLYVTTIAGNGVTGSTISIGDVYAPPVMDSSYTTYFGETDGFWKLRSLSPAGQLSTMGGRYRFFYGDGGPATQAALGPKIFVSLNSTDSVLISDISNVRIRRVYFDEVINTIAGSGGLGYGGDGGPATLATFRNPGMTAVDTLGSVYIADSSNNVIRKIQASTITTVAGTGTAGFTGDGGPATSALFRSPIGVATDASNNLYIADTANHVVRKVDTTTGIVTRIAGTGAAGYGGDGAPATAALLDGPQGLAVDASFNVFVADAGNNRIRKIDGATGLITTYAGTGAAGYGGDGGPATAAILNGALGIAADLSGTGGLYIADTGNHCIRYVDAATGIINRVAGRAQQPGFGGDTSFATFAYLDTPTSVCFDPVSNRFYVADQGNARIRVVFAAENIIYTYAGNGSAATGATDGPLAEAVFGSIFGMARDSAQNIYIADGYGNKIRKVVLSTATITTVAGTGVGGYGGDGGPATSALLSTPTALYIDSADNIYFTDTDNQRVRKIDAVTGRISTFAGSGVGGYGGDGGPATAALLNNPRTLTRDAAGNTYIGDTNNYRIRKVAAPTGLITTFAGIGIQSTVQSNVPAIVSPLGYLTGLTSDSGSNLYFSDLDTNAIWKIRATDCNVEAVSAVGGGGYGGDGGPISAALFQSPSAVSFDACGNLVIADRANYRLRRTYSRGAQRLPNYLNATFNFTNYQNPNGYAYIGLNGSTIASFEASALTDFSYQIADLNILNYPLLAKNPATGDYTPWLEIGQVNTTGYVQLEGFTWVTQTPGQGATSNVVDSNAGAIINMGYLQFPYRLNGITIDNKFNDLSTRSILYNGSIYFASDPALKEEAVDADLHLCRGAFEALPLKAYSYKREVVEALHMQDRHRLGFLTTDVAKVFPKSITAVTDETLVVPSTFQTLDMTQLKFAHIGVTKYMLEEISHLEGTIQLLQPVLEELRTAAAQAQ